MRTVIPRKLYRSSRPGYSGGGRTPVGMGEVQRWIESAQSLRVVSIICLLAEEHLCLYPDGDLLGIYRAAGFEVRHIPVTDHAHPPLSPEQLAAVRRAWSELPKPVLVHCSAGIDRTGAAIQYICNSPNSDDNRPTS
ncbi:MAG: tyrosine-protein phosphatase [Chthoniobacterales bacterium]